MIFLIEQGQSYLPDQQSSLEDRFYNNHSFQQEYRVNDPSINAAATRVQANYRGHKTRQDLEHAKHENKPMIDADRQELGIGREQTETPNESDYHDDRKSSPPFQTTNIKDQQYSTGISQNQEEEIDEVPADEPEARYEDEDSDAERREQDIAARITQAGYRGSKDRKSGHREQESSNQLSDRRPKHQELDNERTLTPRSTRYSEKIDSDRQDLGGNLTANDQIETGENDDTDRPRLQREPTQLSEDFERHTQAPRDPDFERDLQPHLSNEEDDMDHSNLDKAATRIQASYRGYKTRKELGSIGTHDQHPSSTSPRTHDDYDNTHNKALSPSADYQREADVEDDDNAAAVKIQAAYRGYRVRKDLEK